MNEERGIKDIFCGLFRIIDPDIKVTFSYREEGVMGVDVKMKDPQTLIGEKGRVLAETERLLRIIARKKMTSTILIDLDINDYKKRKADYLRDLAQEAAEEVSLTGVDKSFPPMSAFERRIIHLAVSDRDDVITQSVGRSPEKRVFIKKK